MTEQEFHTSNQDDGSQIVATLLQQYHSIAAQLVGNQTSDEAEKALEPIQSQDETVQIAFLKALAKEKTLEAANITQAIYTLNPSKEVRKEARRRQIQFEASDIYTNWINPIILSSPRAVENIIQNGPPALDGEAETLLSELETLFANEDMEEEVPEFQAVVENFLESWNEEDFADAYTLLSAESPIKEGLTSEDWVARREDWSRKASTGDMQIMFVHSNDNEHDEESTQPTFVDAGLSLELTDPEPLTEWPAATISLPETGRHWYWLRYTVVQEDDTWFVQSVTNQASTLTTLSAEELINHIQANETELELIRQRIIKSEMEEEDEDDDEDIEQIIDEHGTIDIQFDPSGPSDDARVIDTTLVETSRGNVEIVDADLDLLDDEDDEDDEEVDFDEVAEMFGRSIDDMDTIVRLVIQNMHYYDAIFAKDPATYAHYYKDAFNLARSINDIERSILYARQATTYDIEERSGVLLNLALAYQALAFKLHEEDDHEREAQFNDLVEPTLRQSVAVEEIPTNLVALATILVLRDHDIDEAEAYFIKAQKGPLTPELAVNIETGLGEIAIINEDYEKAVKHFRALSQLTPDDAAIWYRLGYVHHQLEHINEAIKALQESISLDPELTSAYTELAGIYTTQGNIKQAREIIQNGLDENPEAAELYATMALIYINSNDLPSANRQLTKAESIDRDDEFVQEARQRYNAEIKQRPRPAQSKAQQKQKKHKAKKR